LSFSADWLALREPADRAARDSSLLKKAAAAAGEMPVILDLGSGTGSTMRALSPFLPPSAKWRLVDNDQELLDKAAASSSGSTSLHCLNLLDLEQLPMQNLTLITGSALLDLVSRNWLIELAKLIQVPAYFALSYDGVMSWNPAHELDSSVTKAFNRHQRTDKGFGQALGPDAAGAAEEIFTEAGFEVISASSPWQLGPSEQQLQEELVAGIAQAASEAGESEAGNWRAHRLATTRESVCTIGHRDILALPKESGTRISHAGN
jgi:hypothetical protein